MSAGLVALLAFGGAIWWSVPPGERAAPAPRPAARATALPHETKPEALEARVERLAERMREAPENAGGWVLLARSYAALGRFAESAAAFERAVELQRPADAQVLADYADVAAMVQDRKFDGKPEALIARALATQPTNLKALSLSASAHFQKGDYAGAVRQWRRLLALVPPDSPAGQSARRGIAYAERLAAARN